MITIFNRREVQVFTSLHRCEEAAKALEGHGIQTHVRARDRFSPSVFSGGSRERSGTMFQNPSVQYQYTLYVRRRDYDAARDLLGLVRR